MIHEDIKKRIKYLIKTDGVFHASIFEGPEGIGKRTLARYFAMAIHCESDDAPCGKCPSCIKHQTKNHPDYREITPEDGKKTIAVGRIREAFSDLYIKPLISDKKIIFIPEADLCEAAAQNAMLKSFEEPPPYGIIILAVKNPSSLLPTIRSRAAIYSLNPAPKSEIEKFIKNTYPEQSDKASFLAEFSGGIIGKAVAFSEDNEFSSLRSRVLKLLCDFEGSKLSAFRLADFFKENPDKEPLIFDIALSFFRDLSAFSEGSDNLINSDIKESIEKLSSKISKKGAALALFRIAESKNEKSKNANYDLWITDLLLALWEDIHG